MNSPNAIAVHCVSGVLVPNVYIMAATRYSHTRTPPSPVSGAALIRKRKSNKTFVEKFCVFHTIMDDVHRRYQSLSPQPTMPPRNCAVSNADKLWISMIYCEKWKNEAEHRTHHTLPFVIIFRFIRHRSAIRIRDFLPFCFCLNCSPCASLAADGDLVQLSLCTCSAFPI